MALPDPPTDYAAEVDIQNVTLSWVNGDGAVTVRHEQSTDGVNFSRLDDDTVPTTTSDHSLDKDTHYYLRAKSVNADGESAYTPVIEITTGHYDQ